MTQVIGWTNGEGLCDVEMTVCTSIAQSAVVVSLQRTEAKLGYTDIHRNPDGQQADSIGAAAKIRHASNSALIDLAGSWTVEAHKTLLLGKRGGGSPELFQIHGHAEFAGLIV